MPTAAKTSQGSDSAGLPFRLCAILHDFAIWELFVQPDMTFILLRVLIIFAVRVAYVGSLRLAECAFATSLCMVLPRRCARLAQFCQFAASDAP